MSEPRKDSERPPAKTAVERLGFRPPQEQRPSDYLHMLRRQVEEHDRGEHKDGMQL